MGFGNKIFKALKSLHQEDSGIKTAIHDFGKGMASAPADSDFTTKLATGGAGVGAGLLKRKLMKPVNPINANIGVDAPMKDPDDEAMKRRKALMAGMATMNQGET